jgi:SpoVK/Ycf46/Vps4 family AAA+-type ATPase
MDLTRRYCISQSERDLWRFAFVNDAGKAAEAADAAAADADAAVAVPIARTSPQAAVALGITNHDMLLIRGRSSGLRSGTTCKAVLARVQIIAECANPKDSAMHAFLCLSPDVQRNLGVKTGAKVFLRSYAGSKDVPILTNLRVAIKPVPDDDDGGDAADIRAQVQAFLSKGAAVCVGNTLRIPREDSTEPPIEVVITYANPTTFGFLQLGVGHSITFENYAPPSLEESAASTGFDDIGGMEKELKAIRDMVELPLLHPELFGALQMAAPRGLLMFGPPGTGKTTIARAVANETGANFFIINGPEIVGKGAGESEANLRKAFEEAEAAAPSILFIDEVDSIAPKRDKDSGEVERRTVAQLLTLMDGISSRSSLVIIAATNRPNALDPALRRFGRFDREVFIGPPNEAGRLDILKKKASSMRLADGVNLEQIAASAHGFVGADLAGLVTEAAMLAVARFRSDTFDTRAGPFSAHELAKLQVNQEDFVEALKRANPSAMRDVPRRPDVKWDSVGGMDREKAQLEQLILNPIKFPALYREYGIRPPKGILLYGPPGGGKSMLAQAIANRSGINFMAVKGPELLSMWFGESESNVRDLFSKARASAPCLLFFDEFDALAKARGSDREGGGGGGVAERVVNQFLAEMDGVADNKDVFIIAATNKPKSIDPAVRRPGRLDTLVYIGLPDMETRLSILQNEFKHVLKAEDTFSGSDIGSFDEFLVRKKATCICVRVRT